MNRHFSKEESMQPTETLTETQTQSTQEQTTSTSSYTSDNIRSEEESPYNTSYLSITTTTNNAVKESSPTNEDGLTVDQISIIIAITVFIVIFIAMIVVVLILFVCKKKKNNNNNIEINIASLRDDNVPITDTAENTKAFTSEFETADEGDPFKSSAY